MKNVDEYIDAAKQNLGFNSDFKLNKRLGFKANGVSFWRKKRAFPSPENMVKLAEFAGVSPGQALLELHLWQCQSRQEYRAAEVYEKILVQIKHTARIAALLVFTTPITSANAWGTMHQVIFHIIHYATT